MAALNEIGMLLVSLATIAAGFVFGIWFSLSVAGRVFGWRDRREALGAGPHEPCWTETIPGDGRYLYGRAQCVDDALMEADRRWVGFQG